MSPDDVQVHVIGGQVNEYMTRWRQAFILELGWSAVS
jgi:hypothetical protein